jgi:ribonuclease-3
VSGPGGGSDREALEVALEHRFADPGLLETALTHASLAAELGSGRGNERLEFLGDAVLDLVVADLLYETHPDWDEGQLTQARAALVNRRALARCARQLSLGRFVQLGRTERRSAGTEKDTILANCFEAVVGALYLDAGLPPVEALARRSYGDAISQGPMRDAKTEFQEWAHARLRTTPAYRTATDSGEDADEERFTVEVLVDEEVWGVGIGRSKRAAEQDAARRALERSARDDG